MESGFRAGGGFVWRCVRVFGLPPICQGSLGFKDVSQFWSFHYGERKIERERGHWGGACTQGEGADVALKDPHQDIDTGTSVKGDSSDAIQWIIVYHSLYILISLGLLVLEDWVRRTNGRCVI